MKLRKRKVKKLRNQQNRTKQNQWPQWNLEPTHWTESWKQENICESPVAIFGISQIIIIIIIIIVIINIIIIITTIIIIILLLMIYFSLAYNKWYIKYKVLND